MNCGQQKLPMYVVKELSYFKKKNIPKLIHKKKNMNGAQQKLAT